MYCPVRKREASPKLRSLWKGPSEIVDRLYKVVYLSCRGQDRGVLYWDRLSPYRPLAPLVAGEGSDSRAPSTAPRVSSPAVPPTSDSKFN